MNTRLDGLERRAAAGDMSNEDATRSPRSSAIWRRPPLHCSSASRRTRNCAPQIAVLVEHRMQEQGWLVSSGTSEALSLR